jgi:hypothetical protein
MTRPHVTDQYFLDELSNLVGQKEAIEWYVKLKCGARRKGSCLFEDAKRSSGHSTQYHAVSKTASSSSSESSITENSSPVLRQSSVAARIADEDSSVHDTAANKGGKPVSGDHGLLFTDAAHTVIEREEKNEQ